MSSTDSAARTAAADRYVIRPYERGDVDGILALDRVVWNRERDPAWFRWKYVANPYVDHVPLIVAECDGTIVGARPFMAFHIRAGDEVSLALQPADTMVHPDHRRKGLFTRMTTRAIDRYADGEPAFFFNFPNEQSQPGYLKLGWRTVSSRVTYYRVQNPSAFFNGESRLRRLIGAATTPLAHGYYSARQRLADDADGITTERVPGAPIDELESLYERRVPHAFHARRSAEFLNWRFGSPEWHRETYFALDGGEVIAAAVAMTRRIQSGATTTQIVDVLPMVGGERWETAVEQLLRTVFERRSDTDLFAIANSGVPHELLARFGFARDDRAPLSKLTEHRTALVARPAGNPDTPGAWRHHGLDLDDRDNWCLSFAERDTS
ncbi:GNAT family N-acetyltransferase [Haloferacaceae archaeon DSL9]